MKNRACEDFPHRDVHICQTVFKIRLFFRICKVMEAHRHIRPVAAPALDPDLAPFIQGINKLLLDSLIQTIVKGVQAHGFPENIPEFLTYLTDRIGDDGKAALFPLDIAVHDLSRLIVIGHLQFLLVG